MLGAERQSPRSPSGAATELLPAPAQPQPHLTPAGERENAGRQPGPFHPSQSPWPGEAQGTLSTPTLPELISPRLPPQAAPASTPTDESDMVQDPLGRKTGSGSLIESAEANPG